MSVLDVFISWLEAKWFWCTAVSKDNSIISQLYRHYREPVYLLVKKKGSAE